MYKIYKIASNTVVDFAAEELKKYLRMMMPRCGEITITYSLLGLSYDWVKSFKKDGSSIFIDGTEFVKEK